MSRNRERKAAHVAWLTEQLQGAQSVVLADYRGLDVAADNELRRGLGELGVEYHVVKNTLAWRAAQALGWQELEPYLKGPTALAWSSHDPVSPAKGLQDFARSHEHLQVKGGVLNGRVIDEATVKALASLPSREQLLAQVLAGLQAPLARLAGALAGPLRAFAVVAAQLREQRQASG